MKRRISPVYSHILFTHVPKTAGSTLQKILHNQYGRRFTYVVNAGTKVRDVEYFLALQQKRRDTYRMVEGHWPFGLHEYFSGKCGYISVMRDPVKRLISEYYQIHRQPSHALYSLVTESGMSLEEYLLSDLKIGLDNGQLRLLAGLNEEIPFGGLRKEHLELAIQNIERYYPVVGLTEHFDETILLFKHFLGWKRNPYYHRRNVTESRPETQVSEESLRVVAERNRLEYELYEWVKQRFESQISEFSGEFSDELSAFRTRNESYQRWTLDIHKPKWMQRTEKSMRRQAG